MKHTEIEAKILNINPIEIRQKLLDLGAKKIGQYDFRRYVFDTIPAASNRWIRLRSNGALTTMTVKEIEADTVDGTKEWEVDVSDMDTALIILEKIGLKPRGYQENKREEYDLDGSQITIDFWPKLKPYIEIESQKPADITKIAKRLGYSEGELVTSNTLELYQEIGIDLNKVSELKF
ncbi:adenylate cyclase [Candidatus Saccharibacteria bacterium]|nr:MAG: adenylate cyclase [Candidatus Saccharibacteria bacterium]